MNAEHIMSELMSKDNTATYHILLEAERISEKSDVFYPYIDCFCQMIKNEKSFIRVRGFRMLCKQARWDKENIIDEKIHEALAILHDEKPTAVRQALAALIELLPYKKVIWNIIRDEALSIDVSIYKDTVSGLITSDIQRMLLLMG